MEVSTRLIDTRPINEIIAEIERKNDFTADWFEESLREIADWVDTRWRFEYAKLAEKYANAIKLKNMQIEELREKLCKMTASNREFLDV